MKDSSSTEWAECRMEGHDPPVPPGPLAFQRPSAPLPTLLQLCHATQRRTLSGPSGGDPTFSRSGGNRLILGSFHAAKQPSSHAQHMRAGKAGRCQCRMCHLSPSVEADQCAALVIANPVRGVDVKLTLLTGTLLTEYFFFAKNTHTHTQTHTSICVPASSHLFPLASFPRCAR